MLPMNPYSAIAITSTVRSRHVRTLTKATRCNYLNSFLTPKVCRIMAFWTIITGFAILFTCFLVFR